MESDSSTPTQHSVMLHASTPRVMEELRVSDQSPAETVNNAQVSPVSPGEMQSTEMIIQYCARPAEVTSPGNHPVSKPTTMKSRGVSSAWIHPAEVTPASSENSKRLLYPSQRANINQVDSSDEQRKRTYMKTDSQHIDIVEYYPRVKVERMSQLQINTYCKRIRNHSKLQQLGECK